MKERNENEMEILKEIEAKVVSVIHPDNRTTIVLDGKLHQINVDGTGLTYSNRADGSIDVYLDGRKLYKIIYWE